MEAPQARTPMNALYMRLLNSNDAQGYLASYNEALSNEIREYAKQTSSKDHMEGVFIAGFVSKKEELAALLDTSGTLRDVFIFDDATQVTLEVDLSVLQNEELLQMIANAGVNRLSVQIEFPQGIALQQSPNAYTIPSLTAAFENAARLFHDINLDIVVGDANIKLTAYKSFCSQIVKLPLKHISLYIPNTVAIADDVLADLLAWSSSWLRANGFGQYEFSHFAKPGYESKSNLVAWDRKAYKGFGLKACSFDGHTRTMNEQDIVQYIERANSGNDTIMNRETLTPENAHLEKLMLGLRRMRGVALSTLLEDLSEEKQTKFTQVVGLLKHHGFMREIDGRLFLTQAGLLVENKIISALLV